MPHPNRPRPRQLHHHQTHGAEPDAQSARHGLLPPQAKGCRMGRRLPRQPHRSIIRSPDSPDRDAHFDYINARVKAWQTAGQPAISVDTKKKELGRKSSEERARKKELGRKSSSETSRTAAV